MNSNSEPAGFYQSTQTDADETSDTPAASTISGSIYSTDLSVFTDGSKIVNTVGELSNTYSFTANEDGVLVSDGITVGENTVLPAEYSYDDSGRNTEKSVTLANKTEPVSLLQQYDVNGMITGSGIDEITAHYTYDDSDQLIRTNDSFANYTSSYEYDSRGNMLSKKLYNYTTGDLGTAAPTEAITFTYANSGWKDQLTAVNGTALTYDENGNLLTYGDKTFSWCHGTRLESITDSENTYSYVYDENGTRFSKTVNGTTTQFNYVGGLLLSQKTGDDIIFFQYGAGGVPLGFVYNGVQYFYVTNQLGDVLGITDDTGDAFVMYSYDEWGNPIQTITQDNTEEQNKIAQLNPLRYRGYYYDAETGYYYLQSRYYNPKWGRFISADSFSYIDAFTRLGFNAYIYCENNPIMFVDPSGTEEEFNPNITEQGKAVVQIIFSTIFIDGMLDIIKGVSATAYSIIATLAASFPEIIGNMFLLTEAFFSTLWDEFQNSVETATMKFWDYVTQMFDYAAEGAKKIGEKISAINPFVAIPSFIKSSYETLNSKLFTDWQKYSLISVDFAGLILPYFLPGDALTKSFLTDLITSIADFIMKSSFLVLNGNILH